MSDVTLYCDGKRSNSAEKAACTFTTQGYRGISLTRNAPLLGPIVALCQGTYMYGVPRGGGGSFERDTPVPRLKENTQP